LSTLTKEDLPRFEAQPGNLYLVSTPIGNLGDISMRARDILATVDKIACEDTRITGKLLARLGLNKPLISYREENENRLAPTLAAKLYSGESIALVADAGTPVLSDPGFRLVRECRRLNLPVTPIPGPFAASTALAASGLPTDGFLFAGFLPQKRAARRQFFQKYRDFNYTLVLYESTHRIGKFLEDAEFILGGERTICLARELTKVHETFLTGPLGEVRKTFAGQSHKGEFVICIAAGKFVL